MGVFVPSGPYNKVPHTVTYKQVYLSQVWRWEHWDYGASMAEFWWQPSSRWCPADFSVYHNVADTREKKQTLVTLKGALVSYLRALPEWPCLIIDYLPRVPPPNTVTLGSKVSTLELVGRNTTFCTKQWIFFTGNPKSFPSYRYLCFISQVKNWGIVKLSSQSVSVYNGGALNKSSSHFNWSSC